MSKQEKQLKQMKSKVEKEREDMYQKRIVQLQEKILNNSNKD